MHRDDEDMAGVDNGNGTHKNNGGHGHGGSNGQASSSVMKSVGSTTNTNGQTSHVHRNSADRSNNKSNKRRAKNATR